MKKLFLPLLITFLTGCGSSGGSDPAPAPQPQKESSDGVYLLATVHDPDLEPEGFECADVAIDVSILDGSLYGSLVDDYGDVWEIEGDLQSSGLLGGDLLYNDVDVGNFAGGEFDPNDPELAHTKAIVERKGVKLEGFAGVFSDVWGCSGVFVLLKY